ncbi:hypothetical protein ACFVAV_17885 [Nocardia sp. NPDC057663]|uniref:hypothetical protein n=1 Tax=Nocardia sp. NPDC057663 TaxID=3346201 RepID=UPI00366C910A
MKSDESLSRPLSQHLAKLPPKLRRNRALFLTGLAVVLATGSILAVPLFEDASPDDLVEIQLNDAAKSDLPVGLRDALYADFGVTVGYTVVLAAASLTAWFPAWTASGKRLAAFGVAATIIAALADAAENTLLLIALPDAGSSSVWRISAAVAATVKFCALVPAIVVAVWGIGTAIVRWVQWSSVKTPDQWKPVVEPGPPQEEPPQEDHQQGWRNGYRVPGVDPREVRDKAADKQQHTIGVCLSGGGVRSACVALGAMQTLAEKDVLRQADYVISVSGGGYTAGAYIQSLQRPDPEYCQASSAPPETEPGSPRTPVADPPLALSDMYTEGPVELGRLRRHSSYIANSPAAMITALAVVARNLVTSLLALFAPAVVLGVIAGFAYSELPIVAFTPSHTATADTLEGWSPHPVPVWWAIGLCVGAAALAGWVVMLTQIVGGSTSRRVRSLRRWARMFFLASTVLALLVAAVTVVFPGVLWFSDWLTAQTRNVVGGAAGIVVLNYLAALAAMGWRNKGRVRAQLSRISSLGKQSTAARKAVPRGVLQHLLVVISLPHAAAGVARDARRGSCGHVRSVRRRRRHPRADVGIGRGRPRHGIARLFGCHVDEPAPVLPAQARVRVRRAPRAGPERLPSRRGVPARRADEAAEIRPHPGRWRRSEVRVRRSGDNVRHRPARPPA